MSADPWLPVHVEAQQVALVGRDRVSRLSGAGGVLLHAACVGVVAGSVHLVGRPDLGNTRPVDRRRSVVALEVGVYVDLEVAACEATLRVAGERGYLPANDQRRDDAEH